MAFGPSRQFGHALEAGLFVKGRRLEVVCRHPDASNASRGSLGYEGIEQLAAVAKTSMSLIDPHQLQFGDSRPGITRGDADRASGCVPQQKDQATIIVAACQTPVVTIETFLDGIKFGRRKIMLGQQARNHQIPPYQS